MQVLKSGKYQVVIELSATELLIVSNALNEVCNGIDIEDLPTRLGGSVPELEALSDAVRRAYDRIGPEL